LKIYFVLLLINCLVFITPVWAASPVTLEFYLFVDALSSKDLALFCKLLTQHGLAFMCNKYAAQTSKHILVGKASHYYEYNVLLKLIGKKSFLSKESDTLRSYRVYISPTM